MAVSASVLATHINQEFRRCKLVLILSLSLHYDVERAMSHPAIRVEIVSSIIFLWLGEHASPPFTPIPPRQIDTSAWVLMSISRSSSFLRTIFYYSAGTTIPAFYVS